MDKTLDFEREKSRRVMSENHQQVLRIAELECRLFNETELRELLTWHPTTKSAAMEPILWAAMRNKIIFALEGAVLAASPKDDN